jgi:hypothetical protein
MARLKEGRLFSSQTSSQEAPVSSYITLLTAQYCILELKWLSHSIFKVTLQKLKCWIEHYKCCHSLKRASQATLKCATLILQVNECIAMTTARHWMKRRHVSMLSCLLLVTVIKLFFLNSEYILRIYLRLLWWKLTPQSQWCSGIHVFDTNLSKKTVPQSGKEYWSAWACDWFLSPIAIWRYNRVP